MWRRRKKRTESVEEANPSMLRKSAETRPPLPRILRRRSSRQRTPASHAQLLALTTEEVSKERYVVDMATMCTSLPSNSRPPPRRWPCEGSASRCLSRVLRAVPRFVSSHLPRICCVLRHKKGSAETTPSYGETRCERTCCTRPVPYPAHVHTPSLVRSAKGPKATHSVLVKAVPSHRRSRRSVKGLTKVVRAQL